MADSVLFNISHKIQQKDVRALVVAKKEGNSSVHPAPDLWSPRERGKPLQN